VAWEAAERSTMMVRIVTVPEKANKVKDEL
jgi:hypothetical protein